LTFILRLIFYKVFTRIIPVKQEVDKSCGAIVRDHVVSKPLLETQIPSFSRAACDVNSKRKD